MTRQELIDWAEKNKGASYAICAVAQAILEMQMPERDLEYLRWLRDRLERVQDFVIALDRVIKNAGG